MKQVIAIAVCATGLAACAGMPSLPSFELPKPAPAATTVQFESEPAGAEARTSVGQNCTTPCSLAIAADEFTVTFTRQGFQPQTIPVRVVMPNEPPDPATGEVQSPRLVPNPVYVELQPTPPPPPTTRQRPARPRPKQTAPAAPRRAAPTAMAPPPAAAPAPAPASPWPPPPAPPAR